MGLKLKWILLSGLVALWLILPPLFLSAYSSQDGVRDGNSPVPAVHFLSQALEADVLFRQGVAQYQANQFADAITIWQSAFEHYQQDQNRDRAGMTANAIAAAQLKLSQYASAVTWAQQALAIAEAQADLTAQAQALGNLGIAYLEQGRYWQAVETYQRSLELLPTETPTAATAQLLGLLSNAYGALGNYERAIALQTRSLQMARAQGNTALAATALSNLGSLHTAVGDYAAAMERYQASLRLARANQDDASIAYGLKNLGVVYHALDNLPQAIDYYQQSLAIIRHLSLPALEAAALSNLGIAYEDLGDSEQAIALHRQSLAIAEASTEPQIVATSLNNLSHALLGANRLDEAETLLQRAIDILVNLRQNLSDLYTISVLDTQVHTYNLLQQVLVAQTNYAKALEVAEQGRAQALIDLVAADNPSRNDWTTAAYADLRAVAQQQQATLVEYTLVPEDAFKFKFQAKQRGQTAQLFIWVIQPTGELHFQQQAISDLELPLENLIAQSRRNLAGDRGLWRSIQVAPLAEAAEIGEPLQRLHQTLIAPIQDWLPTNPEAQVILIPHEALFLVPFAALQAADETALIEHHTLAIAPSIQLLAVSQSNASAASASALIVGNPVMPSLALSPGDTPQQLPPLLGAEQEAIAIAQLLKTDALLGETATETQVTAQMEQAPLIHLATHGLLDLNLPTADFTQLQNPGAIALAPSTTADGWLTSPEIAALDLKADLVVLSACDTGLGEITGDGVVGLARSLLGAGAKSTVVSLWAVPDAPTAELMVAFYQQLFAGRGKAHALRQAMLHTKANHPNPRDWAAFVLIGNPG